MEGNEEYEKDVRSFRRMSIGVSCFVLLELILVSVYLGVGRVEAIFFILLFGGFPPCVSALLSAFFRKPASQVILAVTSLLYGGWFAWLVYNAFFLHVDPQSGIVILFTGVSALPGLLPLWLVALIVEKW